MSFLVSLVFGIAVGVAYALCGVRSPAPPLVALFGLLGIVAGEQGVAWLKRPPGPPQSIARSESRTTPTPQDVQDPSPHPQTLR